MEEFRRRLMGYSEAELIKLGRSCSSADPMTKSENAEKYKLCRDEWRRRHPQNEG